MLIFNNNDYFAFTNFSESNMTFISNMSIDVILT